jgi:hypothetical protein
MLVDPDQKISRPRQIYTGAAPRDFVTMENRESHRGKSPVTSSAGS